MGVDHCNSVLHVHCQTAYTIVDETHAVVPEIARDQYWDEPEIRVPYTLATQQSRRVDYVATADNIASV